SSLTARIDCSKSARGVTSMMQKASSIIIVLTIDLIFLPFWWDSRHKMIFHFEGNDASDGLVNTCLGETSLFQSLLDSVKHLDHLTGPGGAEQHIIACIEGQNRSLWHTPLISDTLHI